jgi:hypothetical protein
MLQMRCGRNVKIAPYFLIGAVLVIAAMVLAGCTGMTPGKKMPVNASPGIITTPGGTPEESIAPEGTGGEFPPSGASGTQMWRATFTGSETDDSKTRYTHTEEGGTFTEDQSDSAKWDLQGSFPVLVNYEREDTGYHYYLGSDQYGPVDGTYSDTGHIADSKGRTQDDSSTASYSTAQFEMEIQPDNTLWVRITSEATATGQEKIFEPPGIQNENGPGVNTVTPISSDATKEFSCDTGEPNDNGETRDFSRDGPAYVLTCTQKETDKSLGETSSTSFHVRLTPNVSDTPLPTQYPVASLVTETLPSLVPPTETLPSLIPPTTP